MKAPNNQFIYIKIALLACCLYTCDISHGQEQSLEKQINTEFLLFQKLPIVPQTILKIDPHSQTSSEAQPFKGIIIIKLDELVKIINAIGKKYQRDMIRLILAHELGHQMQYRYQDGTNNITYECQADIIAGYLLFRLIMIENTDWMRLTGIHDINDPKFQKRLADLGDHFNASLTAIFKEGTNYVSLPSHPSSYERQLSLRDGYNYGRIWLFGEAFDDNPILLKSPNIASLRLTGEKYKAMLGFLPQDDLQSWSKRHSLKILHSYLPNCKDIVVYTNYDIDSSNVILNISYRQQITNTGKKTITFNYLNQIYNSKLQESKIILYWELMATVAHSITLAPQETKFIGGSLEFLSSNQYSSFFIYPGKAGSLYSCTTLNDEQESGSKKVHYSFSGLKNQTDEKILESFLKDRDLLASKIGSVGISYQQESTGHVSFLSSLRIPSATSTNILLDRSRRHYDLEAIYYKGVDNIKALESIQNIFQPLTKLEYTLIKIPHDGNSRNQRWNIEDSKHNIVGLILIDYSPSFREYTTSLKIYGL